jgi:hypothetical protein
MNSSINVRPTSTSPPCEIHGERRLTGSVVPCAQLTADERNQMYALLDAYFCRTDRARFEIDLLEKEAAILLRSTSGRIEGFTTFMRMTPRVDGRKLVVFFSGDTIVGREYWGETMLARSWGQTVFAEAVRIAGDRPDMRVYWFLICSGYKTWRFLPVFFREFYPNPDGPTPPYFQRLLDTLGTRKFGDQYQRGSGIVRFHHATPLRRGIAEVTRERLRDPQVAFFARMNPGHVNGDELACVAELSPSNLTRAGQRMVRSA